MNWRATYLILTLVALLSGSSVACKSSSNSAASLGNKTTLVFGFSDSVTGASSNEGKLMRDGYQFWADTVNSKGGLKVGGKSLKVQLKYYDDESNANNAANLTQKLITEDKVDFILGPYGSNPNLTAETVAEKNRYVFLDTQGAADDIFSKGYKYVVATNTLGSQYPVPAIDFLAAQNPKPKLAVVFADDAFSKLVGQTATNLAKNKGLEVIVSQQYPTGLKDFSPLITQMKSSGAEVVFGAGHIDEALQLVKQEQQLSFHPAATIQTVGPTTPTFAQSLGPAAEGQFGVSPWTGTINAFKDNLFGSASDYAVNFKKAMGYDPDYHNAQPSAGAEILGLAIQKANSLDQDKVLAALHELNVTTVGGQFKASSNGSNEASTMMLGQIQKGTFTLVYPDKYAAAKPQFPAK